MLVLLLGLASAGAGERPAASDGGLGGVVDVPLLRSPEDPRPRVLAAVGEDRTLAVVDLLGGPTRVGWGPIYGAGLKTRRKRQGSAWISVVRIPELVVGDAVFRDIEAQVDGGEDLVIGIGQLTGIEAAILPSAGVVRLAPDGTGLVAEVGRPVDVERVPRGRWWEAGIERWADGTAVRVHGVVQGTETGEGTVHLRTDVRDTVVPAEVAAPGTPTRVRLLEWTGPWVEAHADDRVGDPAEDWRGAIGHDALAELDLAVDGDQLAWNPVDEPRWDDPDPLVVALEVLDDRKSEALWRAGRVDESIELSARAAETDGCLPWLVLAMRQLRAGQDPFLALEEGMGRWGAWASLDRETRDRVRAGKRVPDDVGPYQPPTCAQATGRWLLARLAHGDDPGALVDDAAAYDDRLDPWTALALGRIHLARSQPELAEAALRNGLQRDAKDEGRVALAAVLVQRGELEGAAALLRSTSSHPLLVAWVAESLGVPLGSDGRTDLGLAHEVVRSVLQSSRPDPALAGRVERARVRTAGAAWTDVALHLLNGRPVPERWVARSPEAWLPLALSEDPDVRSIGRAALAARFPEWWLPPDGLGHRREGTGATLGGLEGQQDIDEDPR